MRLGSSIYRYARHSRPSLALSLLAVVFLAAVALHLWPEPALRSTFQSYLPYASCVSCTADQLVFKLTSSALITLSYCLLSAGFVGLFILCGRRLPWRWAVLVIAALFAARALTRGGNLFNLWHPVPHLLMEGEALTALLAILAAGIAPLVVPHVDRLLRNALECRHNEARFLAAAEGSLDGFYILKSVRDSDGDITDFKFTYINPNGERLLGLPLQQVLGAHLCALMPLHRAGGFFEDYVKVVRTGEAMVHEFPSRPGEEGTCWMRHQVVRLEDGIAITAADITERKQAEHLAHHRAQHDVLTGLPNRSLLSDRLGQAIERADRYHQKVAVFMVDLDSFKQINDTMGHMAGDLVLATVAKRLRESVRATDSVLRIGGDEFLVIMPDIAEDIDILRSAAKMLAALGREGPVGLTSLVLSCSLGIAIYPTLARSAADLIARADGAMYRAKYRGGNCYEVCDGEVSGTYPPTSAAFPSRKIPAAPVLVPQRSRPSSGPSKIN